MHYTTLLSWVVALSTVTAVPVRRNGWGSFTVKNTCSFPIYFQSVPGGDPTPPAAPIQSGQSHTEGYHLGPNGGGVSFKMNRDINDLVQRGNALQFEITPASDGNVYFDMSLINNDGNISDSWVLNPEHPDEVECLIVSPARGNFYVPHVGGDDNKEYSQTKACPVEQNLIFTAC